MPRVAPDVGQQLHDLDRRLGIERGRGLVGEQQLRLLHHGARDAHALALAAGQRVGAAMREAREPDDVEQLERLADVVRRELAPPRAPRRHVAQPARQQVLHHRQALDEVVLLEHHADVAARLAQRRAATACARSAPSNRISPAVGSTSRLMQRISVLLPVPDGADDRRDAARGDLEVDVGQHRLAGDVRLRQVARAASISALLAPSPRLLLRGLALRSSFSYVGLVERLARALRPRCAPLPTSSCS